MFEQSFCISREDIPFLSGPLLRDGLLENRGACVFTGWVRRVSTGERGLSLGVTLPGTGHCNRWPWVQHIPGSAGLRPPRIPSGDGCAGTSARKSFMVCVPGLSQKRRSQRSPGDDALSHKPRRMQIEVVPEAGVPGGAGPVQGAPRCVCHSLQLSMISLEIPSLSSWYCSSSLTDKEIKTQECLFALSCVDGLQGGASTDLFPDLKTPQTLSFFSTFSTSEMNTFLNV